MKPVFSSAGLLAALAVGLASAQSTPTISRYVALGDSLTAGYQSGGLRADGQRAAYPTLLAKALKVPFALPLTQDPGCPPPLGARAAPTSCQRLNPGEKVSDFAVPGAQVGDVRASSAKSVTPGARPLYTLILGPDDTQVSAALKSRPDLITLWIGSNNILGPVLSGNLSAATPPAQFEASYARLLDALKPSGARVVLLTVPDVTRVPALIPGARLAELGLGDASCAGSQAKVSAATLLRGGLTATFANKLSCSGPGVLTPQEVRRAQETVNAYNTSIRRLAAGRGYAVFEVGDLLTNSRDVFTLDFSNPFGPDFSLDGVHPSSLAHAKLAAALTEFIKRTYNVQPAP